jgi:hypothetical protein
MTPEQLKAARALLGWGIDRLASRSDSSVSMVTVFEQTGRVVLISSRNRTVPVDAVAAIHNTLEEAGIEFTDGDAPGVRLRKVAGPE